MPKLKFAQFIKLSCDPTTDELLKNQDEYNQVQGKTTILSLDKNLQPFFSTHLKHTAKIYQLAARGTHAEIVLNHNKLIHQKHSQSTRELSTLSDYLIHKSRSLRQLETTLMNSLNNEVKQLLQNIQNTIEEIYKNHRQIMANQFELLKEETSKQLKLIKANLDRLEGEFNPEVLIKRNLKQEELLKFAGITKQQSLAYGTLFKILSDQTIKELQANKKNPEENCQRQLFIDKQKLNKISCHDLWCLMELIAKKKDQPPENSIPETQKSIDFSKFETHIDRDQVINRFEEQIFKIESVIIEELSNNISKKSKSNDVSLSQTMIEKSITEGVKLLTDFIKDKPIKKFIKSIKSDIQKQFLKFIQDFSFKKFLQDIQKMKKTFEEQIKTELIQKAQKQISENEEMEQISQPQANTAGQLQETQQQFVDNPLVPQPQQFDKNELSQFHYEAESEQICEKTVLEQYGDLIIKILGKNQQVQDEKESIGSESRKFNFLDIIPDYLKRQTSDENQWTLGEKNKQTTTKQPDSEQESFGIQSNMNAKIYQHKFEQQREASRSFENSAHQNSFWLSGMNDPEQRKEAQKFRQSRKKEDIPIYPTIGTTRGRQFYNKRKGQQKNYQFGVAENVREQQRRQLAQNPMHKRFNQEVKDTVEESFYQKQAIATEEFLYQQTLKESLKYQKIPPKTYEPFASNIQEIKPPQGMKPYSLFVVNGQKQFEQKQENSIFDIESLLNQTNGIHPCFSITDLTYNSEVYDQDVLQFDEDFELTGRKCSRFKIQNKQFSRGRMTIRDINRIKQQLHNSKDAFSITVQVIKPVLLTFKVKDRRKNCPMTKLIVADSTGIGVLYMKYYCEVKAGCYLRLHQCRLHNYCGSFEINYHNNITHQNISNDFTITRLSSAISLSSINRSNQNKFEYNVRSSFNSRLYDCIKEMSKNRTIRIGEMDLYKPIIVTVCKKLIGGGYLIGDYTGMIVADFSNLRREIPINKNDTLIVRRAKLRIDQGRVFLIATPATVMTKADIEFKFYHDEKFIPQKIIKAYDRY